MPFLGVILFAVALKKSDVNEKSAAYLIILSSATGSTSQPCTRSTSGLIIPYPASIFIPPAVIGTGLVGFFQRVGARDLIDWRGLIETRSKSTNVARWRHLAESGKVKSPRAATCVGTLPLGCNTDRARAVCTITAPIDPRQSLKPSSGASRPLRSLH